MVQSLRVRRHITCYTALGTRERCVPRNTSPEQPTQGNASDRAASETTPLCTLVTFRIGSSPLSCALSLCHTSCALSLCHTHTRSAQREREKERERGEEERERGRERERRREKERRRERGERGREREREERERREMGAYSHRPAGQSRQSCRRAGGRGHPPTRAGPLC